jgi:cytochrome P450
MPSTLSTPVLRRIEDLPGPRSWPLVGNMLQVSLSRIHQDVEAWCRIHGPLFRLMFGPTPVLVIADHETVLAVLRDRPDTIGRSSRLREVGEEMGAMPGLFNAEGQAWRHQRRMVMAAFDPAHVRGYFPSLLRVAQRLRARWKKAAASGASIDLQSDLKRFTVEAIAGLAFGSEVDALESDNDDPIHRHLDVVFAGTYRRAMSPLPYWRWLRLPVERRLERSAAAVGVAIQGFVAQARERLRADPHLRDEPRNLLEAMIVAADRDDAVLSDREVAGNVSTLLFAGEDTTANTLAWLIWLLKRNPVALDRATDEVRRLAPDLAALAPERLDRLGYLDACVSEAMRLKPVAPFLGLEALRDTTIADVHVPAGTLLWCVLRHDSVDERHFPDAAAFAPHRWLDGGGADRRISMPFGAGPRICPGRYLALLEIRLAMAMLLGGFEIDSVTTPDGGEAREAMSFTMNPVGLRMRLREASD